MDSAPDSRAVCPHCGNPLEMLRKDYGYCCLCRDWPRPTQRKQQASVCDCVVAALAEMAPDPRTEPGRHFVCATHGQVVVFDGGSWKWSNQPEDIQQLDIQQLPRMADCAGAGTVSE